jgi:hypothetical protein
MKIKYMFNEFFPNLKLLQLDQLVFEIVGLKEEGRLVQNIW